MFKLVNEYGNCFKSADTKEKRDYLIKNGYKLVEDKKKVVEKKPETKKTAKEAKTTKTKPIESKPEDSK